MFWFLTFVIVEQNCGFIFSTSSKINPTAPTKLPKTHRKIRIVDSVVNKIVRSKRHITFQKFILRDLNSTSLIKCILCWCISTISYINFTKLSILSRITLWKTYAEIEVHALSFNRRNRQQRFGLVSENKIHTTKTSKTSKNVSENTPYDTNVL